jgi:hypothetical protein
MSFTLAPREYKTQGTRHWANRQQTKGLVRQRQPGGNICTERAGGSGNIAEGNDADHLLDYDGRDDRKGVLGTIGYGAEQRQQDRPVFEAAAPAGL